MSSEEPSKKRNWFRRRRSRGKALDVEPRQPVEVISEAGPSNLPVAGERTDEFDVMRMYEILQKSTDEILALPADEQNNFLDWLLSADVDGAKELRAAILQRQNLLQQSETLQQQLFETRKRRAAQFGPLGRLLFTIFNRRPRRANARR